MNSTYFDVIVIGAGASGMMAAGTAAREGKSVLLIEKNNVVGKKLSITGGGRCNITNAEHNQRTLLKNYGDADKFLFSTFNQFDIKDTFDFFETKQLPIKIEDRNRAFPKSEKATDVTALMQRYITHENITLLTNTLTKSFNCSSSSLTSVDTSAGLFTAKRFIVATGGASHPETGSTGDGFNWLSQMGHTVTSPTPGLVPWKVTDSWIREMSGSTIEDVAISIITTKSKKKVRGRILCTHFGLSGPTIINASHILRDAFHAGDFSVCIDMLPSLDYGQINTRLLEIFQKNSNKQLKSVMRDILGYSVPESFIGSLNIQKDIRLRDITREARTELVKKLKAIPLNVTGFKGYGKSIVADGGVSLDEIDWKTMRSLKISNLSITGDLLNIRRPSGGYSLQLCWTTGYVAGKHA